MTMTVSPTTKDDLASIVTILDQTDLFPSDMLADMIAGYLDGSDVDAIWLSHRSGAAVDGFCYATQEQLAQGTWNMLAIAVLPATQARGTGTMITTSLEDTLRPTGARILIADTSGTAAFSQTRNFYAKNGYTEQSRIRDFWAAGDDKVTFRKAL